MIQIVEGRYFVGFWYIELPRIEGDEMLARGGNVLAALWRDKPEQDTWHVQYRFRYYKDKNLWPAQTEDVFHWTQMRLEGKTEAEAEALTCECANQIAAPYHCWRCQCVVLFDHEKDSHLCERCQDVTVAEINSRPRPARNLTFDCDHNRMIATGDPEYAWRCVCGYVYGSLNNAETQEAGTQGA